jgi:superfamily II DNA or RNA helicase
MFDKAKAIEKKIEIQQNAVNLLTVSRRILLSWATGCGKTLASLKMIKKYYNYKPTIKGYVICKESTHIDNWIEDIREHNMGFIHHIADYFLYASVHKYADKGFVDFVIMDECHAITEKRAEHLKKIIGPDTLVIMLSATVDWKKQTLLRNVTNVIKEYHIDIGTAINEGLLPAPVVVVHKVTMRPAERIEYDLLTTEVNKYGDEYQANGDKWKQIKWVNAGSKRKRAMSEMKTTMAAGIVEDFEDARFICFTGSQWQAEELADKTDNYVHSGRSKKENKEKIREFNDEEIHSLFVVNMMRESINLKNVEKGLIVQLDNVKLSFIQMLGRVFRSSMPEMHIIVYKDSQDEVYLNRVMKGFPVRYVKTIEH